MEIKAKKDFVVNFFFVTIWLLIIFITVKFLFLYLLPIVFAIFIAFLVQKPSNFLSKKIRLKKEIISVVLTLLLYVAIIGAFSLISFLIIKFIGTCSDDIPIFFETISNFSEKLFLNFKLKLKNLPPLMVQFIDSSAKSIMNLSGEFASDKITGFLTGFAQKTPMFLITWVVTIVISCYIAKDFEKLGVFFKEIISEKIIKKFISVKNIFKNSVFKIMLGYFFMMLITLAILWVSFIILGINNSFLIALIVSIIDLLPILGVGVVLIPWSVFSFVFGNTFLGMGLIICYFAVFFTRNFLEPKIISKQIGINPLLTLLSMFVGLKFIGVGGMILSPLVLLIVLKYYKEEY